MCERVTGRVSYHAIVCATAHITFRLDVAPLTLSGCLAAHTKTTQSILNYTNSRALQQSLPMNILRGHPARGIRCCAAKGKTASQPVKKKIPDGRIPIPPPQELVSDVGMRSLDGFDGAFSLPCVLHLTHTIDARRTQPAVPARSLTVAFV